jgi:hypothetical protein
MEDKKKILVEQAKLRRKLEILAQKEATGEETDKEAKMKDQDL